MDKEIISQYVTNQDVDGLMTYLDNYLNRRTVLTEIKSKLIDSYDFEKVHTIMEKLDWKWYIPKEKKTSIPSIEMIKEFVSELIDDIINYLVTEEKDFYRTASGGFDIIFMKLHTDEYWANISFNIESITYPTDF